MQRIRRVAQRAPSLHRHNSRWTTPVTTLLLFVCIASSLIGLPGASARRSTSATTTLSSDSPDGPLLATRFEASTRNKPSSSNMRRPFQPHSQVGPSSSSSSSASSVPSGRPPPSQRRFVSAAVDKLIANYTSRMVDKDLATLFSNCLPNTLDTTVYFSNDSSASTGQQLDTFIVTGDIDAMWLRDSTNQVWPYLELATEDEALRDMFRGLIHRQVYCVRTDAYANAFNRDMSTPSPYMTDNTFKLGFLNTSIPAMTTHLHERKYELDSLCAVMKLSCGYYQVTLDRTPYDDKWFEAMSRIVEVIREQQAGSDDPGPPPYTFSRETTAPTDTLMHSVGVPGRRTGMSKSPFRPSDDAATLPFPIAANGMAVVALGQLAELLGILSETDNTHGQCLDADKLRDLAGDAKALAKEIQQGIAEHGVINHPRWGKIFAYEVDGFGNGYAMDDANVPSLLSLPYLGFCPADDPTYTNTRKFLLSSDNPYYSLSSVGPLPGGIGGPHIGRGYIWPMSITVQAFTSEDDEEIKQCLEMLKRSNAGTGFMHESFWKDNVNDFTRPWFAWANSLFGGLILNIAKERPHLIFGNQDIPSSSSSS